jgi:HAD superfamily hydrolase (TIGR01450 family)
VTRVAFLGLGGMGSRMARRLLEAGHELVVWNRTTTKADPLVALGATRVDRPADAAGQVEVVITMVSDPPALRAVSEGPDGIASGLGSATTVIEMSTVGPTGESRLESVLAHGAGLLDAPVLGSVTEAESGSLTIFVGGSSPLVERWTPLLSTFGSVVHVGGLGAGAAAKLVANATLFGTLGTLGEAIALADGLGLSRDATYEVLAATPLAAQAERRRGAIEAGDYPPRFPLALARKDATLIREAAAAARVDLRLAEAAATWLAEAEEAGFGNRDYSAVLATIPQAGEGDRSRPAPNLAGVSGEEPVDFDGLIVDLDGVVWRGAVPIDGAAEAIAAVRANGTRVVFLTNEPGSSRSTFALRLTDMGIPATAADVMTSAAATARAVGLLEDLTTRQAFVVGPPALHDEIKEAGFELLSREEAPQADVVVVGGHPGFDYEELRAASTAVRNGARLFATGRDAVFPTPQGPWPGTGAILAAIETAGGAPAVVVGKPEPIMFEIAREALAGCERVGVVGDHLISDIAGAKRAGLGAILVLTGTTTRSDLQRATIQPDLVLESLAEFPNAMRPKP